MKAGLAVLALAGSAAAQAVTQLIVPSSTPPSDCQNSRQGQFGLSIVNVTNSPSAPSPSRRGVELQSRQKSGTLMMTLEGGVLKDMDGRIGYVASNYQFQFDGPPQAGAIYTAGFSVCQNNSIAIGGHAIWYQCLSGTFYNLYDRDWAAHCNAVYFQAVGGGQLFSTAPPGPESTGPSEANIANGGGTQSSNGTQGASPTGSSNGTTTGSGSAATTTGSSSGGSSDSGSGSSDSGSGSSGSTSSSAGGAAATGVSAMFPLAMGVVGAIALL